MIRLKPFLFSAFVLLCFGILSFATARIKEYRAKLPPMLVSRQAVLANPKFMDVVSGEFKGVLADYLLLKALILDGGEPDKMTKQDWEAVYLLYKQSLALDPYFYQTAYYIQGNLFWREGMADKGIELLKISARYRSWDWTPLWYLGFDYAYFLNKKELAASYFFKASKLPGAPMALVIIAARLAKAGGDTQTSIAMLKAMREQTDNREFKKILTNRIQAHMGVLQIEKAIQRFKHDNGRLPLSLDELLSSGLLRELPSNAYGGTYKYDPTTGSVDYGKN